MCRRDLERQRDRHRLRGWRLLPVRVSSGLPRTAGLPYGAVPFERLRRVVSQILRPSASRYRSEGSFDATHPLPLDRDGHQPPREPGASEPVVVDK